MRLLILGLNYLPESTSIGPYTADLAEFLVQRGHQVQVITGFPQAPQWRIWDGYRGRRFMRETIHGVPIRRTWTYVPSQPQKTIRRILFDTSFAVSALLQGLSTGAADLLVVISPPLQLGLTGWLLGRWKRAPFFFHIQDLVPDAAMATGMLKENSIAIRLARRMERFVYGNARGIGVICDGFARNLVTKGVLSDKIALLPDYIDLDRMCPSERYNGFRQQHGIEPDDLLVMYSGSIALKQGLQTFVDAAAECRPDEGIKFFLVGEGPYKQELERRAQELGLPHLHFLPLQPRNTLSAQLSAADILLITQRRAVTDVVFPGKLLYYMAARRPVVAAVSADSETGRFVSQHQVGIVVPPEEPQTLAQAIRYLKSNPQTADRLGRNGRQVVEAGFERKLVLERFAAYLENLAAKS